MKQHRPQKIRAGYTQPVMKLRAGYTLLELLISMSIILLLGVGALTSFVQSRNVRELTTSAEHMLAVLRLAQSKTIGGEDNTAWGVHAATSTFQYMLFQGTSYTVSSTTQIYTLPQSIEFSALNLSGGGNNVIFKRLTGRTNQQGTITLRVKGSASVVSITIDASGKVYQSGNAPDPLGTRMVDTRHRSFVLGWSIKNATTMTLTFSNPPQPDSMNSITMAPYFDAGKTKFDWNDTITVWGENQTLRIHTISLTDTNTTLSIDRDCRYNTKKVRIAIDTKNIATYESNCETVTVENFGGVMSEP